MRRLAAALLLAIALVVPTVAFLPQLSWYPPRCSTATGVGDFCINYVPELGRYEVPPAGVPADFARVDLAASGVIDLRPALGLLLFFLALPALWIVLGGFGPTSRASDIRAR